LAGASFALREGTVETLSELRRRGLTLGIISNSDDRTLPERTGAARLTRQVDFVLSSEAAQSCKPDPRIFEAARQRAGCSPGEALFVGDTLDQDIAGGTQAGLRTVLLVPAEQLDLSLPRGDAQPEFVIRELPDVLRVLDQMNSPSG
jgi:putative hydrolase of the HAD superfamily